MFYISLAPYFIAGVIFIILCATFKSVWLEKPEPEKEKSDAQKRLKKLIEYDKKVETNLKDTSKKETKYNTTWKKVWDK